MLTKLLRYLDYYVIFPIEMLFSNDVNVIESRKAEPWEVREFHPRRLRVFGYGIHGKVCPHPKDPLFNDKVDVIYAFPNRRPIAFCESFKDDRGNKYRTNGKELLVHFAGAGTGIYTWEPRLDRRKLSVYTDRVAVPIVFSLKVLFNSRTWASDRNHPVDSDTLMLIDATWRRHSGQDNLKGSITLPKKLSDIKWLASGHFWLAKSFDIKLDPTEQTVELGPFTFKPNELKESLPKELSWLAHEIKRKVYSI